MSNPLSYSISDWHQLTKDVKSNNSHLLHIGVVDLIQNNDIVGTRIYVSHETFGTLFSYVVNAKGNCISEVNDNIVYEFTTAQILAELSKYGFNIVYEQAEHLPDAQLNYLKEMLSLGFDKLRLLSVWSAKHSEKQYKPYLVVFNVEQNPSWLNNGYVASETELLASLKNGSAVNISATVRRNGWSWGWLDFVANIEDILAENGVVL